jgi:hypothetical protein
MANFLDLPDEVKFNILKRAGSTEAYNSNTEVRGFIARTCADQTGDGTLCSYAHNMCDKYCKTAAADAFVYDLQNIKESPLFDLGAQYKVPIGVYAHGHKILKYEFEISRANVRMYLDGSVTYGDYVTDKLGISSVQDKKKRIVMNTLNGVSITKNHEDTEKLVRYLSSRHRLRMNSMEVIWRGHSLWRALSRAAGVYGRMRDSGPFEVPDNTVDKALLGLASILYDVNYNVSFGLKKPQKVNIRILGLDLHAIISIHFKTPVEEGDDVDAIFKRTYVKINVRRVGSDELREASRVKGSKNKLLAVLRYLYTDSKLPEAERSAVSTYSEFILSYFLARTDPTKDSQYSLITHKY